VRPSGDLISDWRSLRVQVGNVRRSGLGIGLIATVLLPLALLFFGALRLDQTVSAILLFSGLWAFVFGLLMERKDERLYYSGFGVVVALLSTFLFIQLRYTAGLVVVASVALALVSALFRPGAPRSPKGSPK
jgi:hypothetical protein